MLYVIITHMDTQEFKAYDRLHLRLMDCQQLMMFPLLPHVHYHLLVLSMLRGRLLLQRHVTRLPTSLLYTILLPLVIRTMTLVS